MYKAVLFDMDGTVLNTLGDLADSMNYSLRHFNMPEREEQEMKSFLEPRRPSTSDERPGSKVP